LSNVEPNHNPDSGLSTNVERKYGPFSGVPNITEPKNGNWVQARQIPGL